MHVTELLEAAVAVGALVRPGHVMLLGMAGQLLSVVCCEVAESAREEVRGRHSAVMVLVMLSQLASAR